MAFFHVRRLSHGDAAVEVSGRGGNPKALAKARHLKLNHQRVHSLRHLKQDQVLAETHFQVVSFRGGALAVSPLRPSGQCSE